MGLRQDVVLRTPQDVANPLFGQGLRIVHLLDAQELPAQLQGHGGSGAGAGKGIQNQVSGSGEDLHQTGNQGLRLFAVAEGDRSLPGHSVVAADKVQKVGVWLAGFPCGGGHPLEVGAVSIPCRGQIEIAAAVRIVPNSLHLEQRLRRVEVLQGL